MMQGLGGVRAERRGRIRRARDRRRRRGGVRPRRRRSAGGRRGRPGRCDRVRGAAPAGAGGGEAGGRDRCLGRGGVGGGRARVRARRGRGRGGRVAAGAGRRTCARSAPTASSSRASRIWPRRSGRRSVDRVLDTVGGRALRTVRRGASRPAAACARWGRWPGRTSRFNVDSLLLPVTLTGYSIRVAGRRRRCGAAMTTICTLLAVDELAVPAITQVPLADAAARPQRCSRSAACRAACCSSRPDLAQSGDSPRRTCSPRLRRCGGAGWSRRARARAASPR